MRKHSTYLFQMFFRFLYFYEKQNRATQNIFKIFAESMGSNNTTVKCCLFKSYKKKKLGETIPGYFYSKFRIKILFERLFGAIF